MERSTNLTCLQTARPLINVSVCVMTKGPWPPGNTNCGIPGQQPDQPHVHAEIPQPCEIGPIILGHRMSFVCLWFDATRLVTCERTRRMCGNQDVGMEWFWCKRHWQLVGRLQRIGRQSRHSQKLEKGRIRSGHLFPAYPQWLIFRIAARRFLGRSGARQTDCSSGRALECHSRC